MGDERFDIDVGYRDPDDLPRDDFPEDKPSPAEYEQKTCPHPKACWGEMVCLSVEGGGRLCDDWKPAP